LRDKEGTPIAQRALIWEGVSLVPESAKYYQAKATEKNLQKEKTDKLLNVSLTDTIKVDRKKELPNGLEAKIDEL
jgi:hypothetical protein